MSLTTHLNQLRSIPVTPSIFLPRQQSATSIHYILVGQGSLTAACAGLLPLPVTAERKLLDPIMLCRYIVRHFMRIDDVSTERTCCIVQPHHSIPVLTSINAVKTATYSFHATALLAVLGLKCLPLLRAVQRSCCLELLQCAGHGFLFDSATTEKYPSLCERTSLLVPGQLRTRGNSCLDRIRRFLGSAVLSCSCACGGRTT